MEAILIEVGITFVMSLIGAILKDYYNTIAKADAKVQITRILLSAITGAIIIYSFNIRYKVGDRLWVLCSFGAGILGLELFSKIKDINVEKLISILTKK